MKKIQLWLIYLASMTLAGCASDPVTLPDWDLQRSSVEAQRPLERPTLPNPVSSTEDTVTFAARDFKVLVDVIDVGDANYKIAEENAAALDAQSAAYNQLIEAGKLQRRYAEVREEQLARERRDHFLDNWFHRGLIALGILVAL